MPGFVTAALTITTRRSLLSGSALVAVGALLPRLGRADEVADWHGRPWQVALAVADALFSDLGDNFPSVEHTHFATELRRFLLRMDPAQREELAQALAAVEYSPPLVVARLSRFSSLDRAGRRAVLDAWADHWLPQLRAGARALKLVLAPPFFTDPGTWDAIGYDGPWVGRIDVPYFELEPPVDDLPIDQVLP